VQTEKLLPRIIALLVGIDKYTAISPLHGCVGDITAVETLLKARIPAESLSLRVLHDGAATRDAIIDGFQSHLGQATADDVALFYFCGHGSQEACPPEWMTLEPSGMLQTTVPVDARIGDTFDIADKELSALIHAVAANGAQVVTMFDSCSSGGATRSAEDAATAGVARMAPSSTQRKRAVMDYIAPARTLYDPARIAAHGPPQPSHIAIAACQNFETAKEYRVNNVSRGAFTQAFEAAVGALGPSATYVDLVTAIRTTVRVRAKDQMPSLSVTGSADAATLFLDGKAGVSTMTANFAPSRSASSPGHWWLSAGLIDGIPESGTVTVNLHARDAFLRDGIKATPVATAIVGTVEIDRASLRIAGDASVLDPTAVYSAVITAMGSVPLHVMVTGTDATAVGTLHAELSARAARFAVVAERSADVPTITVQVSGSEASILGMDGAVLQGMTFVTKQAASIAGACAHIARWYGVQSLAPVSSTLNGKVVIDIVPAVAKEQGIPLDRPAHPVKNGTVTLTYDGAVPPRLQLRLRNTSGEALYVVLVDLSDDFGSSVLFEDWMQPNSVAVAKGGRAVGLEVGAWRDPSYTVGFDYIKVVAAKAQFGSKPFAFHPLLPDGVARVVVDEVEDASFWGTSLVRVEYPR